jgi:hypothetical protein
MERRFRVRMDELLIDAEVSRGLLRGVMPRLEAFLEPFVAALGTMEQRTNARHYVSGLMSDLDGKDVESIAYLHDRERQGLQKFIGQSEWDHRPLLAELARRVATELGEADGVLVFDPSAFPKQGTESVGVQRQWCGRLGKIENCQVGIYLGYVSDRDHALVDFRLYLSKEWANRKRRRNKAGVPAAIRFRTRHELMLEMLDERGPLLVVSPGIAVAQRVLSAGRAIQHAGARLDGARSALPWPRAASQGSFPARRSLVRRSPRGRLADDGCA